MKVIQLSRLTLSPYHGRGLRNYALDYEPVGEKKERKRWAVVRLKGRK